MLAFFKFSSSWRRCFTLYIYNIKARQPLPWLCLVFLAFAPDQMGTDASSGSTWARSDNLVQPHEREALREVLRGMSCAERDILREVLRGIPCAKRDILRGMSCAKSHILREERHLARNETPCAKSHIVRETRYLARNEIPCAKKHTSKPFIIQKFCLILRPVLD